MQMKQNISFYMSFMMIYMINLVVKSFDNEKQTTAPVPITILEQKLSKEYKGYYLKEYIKDSLGNKHNDEYDTIEEVLQKIKEFHSDGIYPGGIVYEKKFTKNRDPKYSIRIGNLLTKIPNTHLWKESSSYLILSK